MKNIIVPVFLLLLLPFFLSRTGIAAPKGQLTENRLYIVDVKMDALQPEVGSNTATLTLYDATSGARIEGATIDVSPWMTMHGHGSKKAIVTAVGNGVYRVKEISFTMEGDWDLMVTIIKSGRKDTAVVPVKNVK